MNTQYVIVLVTTSNKQEAESIARTLLEKHLVACANIVGPISSHFHWSGKIEQVEEYLIFLKSRIDLFDEIAETVRQLHSYEVPEMLGLPVVIGSKNYLVWLAESLKGE